MLSDGENERYRRQVPVIGAGGQERLKSSRVLIAGAGGLGSAIASYLAAAGVGTIRIADQDVLEPGNMNRQILYRDRDIGRIKVVSAEEQIKAINPYVKVEAYNVVIDRAIVGDLVEGVDVIADALDNLETRYLLNEAGIDRNVPFIHGAVDGFYGQVSTLVPGLTPCLRCLVPEPPTAKAIPIIGVTCGAIGSIQATEAIKYLTGKGDLLTNRMLFWDGMRGDVDVIAVEKNPGCHRCGKP